MERAWSIGGLTFLAAGVVFSGCAGHAASEISAGAALRPQVTLGQQFGDAFSRTLVYDVPGFDPYVRGAGGKAAYRVTIVKPDTLTLAGHFVYDGSPAQDGNITIQDAGGTICYQSQCAPSSDASGLAFNPRLWDPPAGTLHVGQSWQVTLPAAWDLGPAGTETVTVLTVDAANGIVRLRRSGSGQGAAKGDMQQLGLYAKGKQTMVTLTPGRARWSGETTIQGGILLSDVTYLECDVNVGLPGGATVQGKERQTSLLNAIDPVAIWN